MLLALAPLWRIPVPALGLDRVLLAETKSRRIQAGLAGRGCLCGSLETVLQDPDLQRVPVRLGFSFSVVLASA